MSDENHGKDVPKEPVIGARKAEDIDADEIAKKYDASTRFRQIKGKVGLFVSFVAVSMSVFHLVTAGVLTMSAMQHRAVHLTFAIVLVFLLYPMTKKSNMDRPTVFDYLFSILGAVSVGYLVFMFEDIARRGLNIVTLDIAMGVTALLLVLEGGRRSIGKQLPVIAVICLAYAYLGPYLPGGLAHRGFSFTVLVERMYLGNEGIFGIALGVSATYVFLFVLFGAFLNGTGMSGLFTNAAISLAGHRPGGPAKVSILASGSLGMINGSAVANVATTGVFSIPLMEKVGYRKNFAAGVEAVASTGGQIMPPIMGAAAFIMAEFLGVPYTQIIIAALVPAILYFVALWFMVHFEAMKTDLTGLPKDQLPRLKPLIKRKGHLLLPIILLLTLLFLGYTPVFAAFYATVATYFVSMVRKETRMSASLLWKTLEGGAKGAVFITMATAVVGIVVGVISLTGVGLQLANIILSTSQGYLFPTLIMTMVACIVLGMGLPTTACYIVAVVVAAPALVNLGVEPLVAHMFVLYFAVLSNITPPVALASYTAAGVSNANPSRVSWVALRLGIAGFLVPFMFVYSPSLLLQHDDYSRVAIAIVTASVGVFALAVSVVGFWRVHLGMIERALMFAAALVLIQGGYVADIIGIGVLGVVWFLQINRLKKFSAHKKIKMLD
ncbi:TRAP transporter permease [Halomonas sp. M5N1S17]|uniref:TRAP transporter permease n=1 Tax=Halomonas alkalisoli TaxID=2907158 RepID=UPI001F453C05|nr:TRAP transporter permease [Halomonas alkalisoli]MCE9662182.1 TRAP transporter permease [Halomonas alkalisoli]